MLALSRGEVVVDDKVTDSCRHARTHLDADIAENNGEIALKDAEVLRVLDIFDSVDTLRQISSSTLWLRKIRPLRRMASGGPF